VARVFLSYVRADEAKAQAIAQALERAGHSVWWDRHIKSGAQYSKEIEQALSAADAVVVLWSERSADSPWVRDEAAAGRDSGRLVPVKLDPSEPPLGFRQYQAIDLSGWSGRGRPRQMQVVMDAVDAVGDGADAPAKAHRARASAVRQWPGQDFNPWWIVGVLAVLLGLWIARPWEAKASIPTVTVVPGDNSASSRSLAGNLLVQLGSLQAANADALQLVEPDSAGEADMTFKVGGVSEGSNPRTQVSLVDNGAGTLLWSRELVQPGGSQGDLRQQVAFSAAQVLRCATEALSPDHPKLPLATLKLYLNGCAQHAETLGSDPREVAPVFLEVTERAPRFEPAWAKLLLAESAMVSPADAARSPVKPAQLRAHIEQARKLNPAMAEALLAEIRLWPQTALIEKVRLIDQAVARQPDNPHLLAFRSGLLGRVGRWRDAVADARLASEKEPLSPAFRHAYILALAYSGRIETAFAELANAERLWPGASDMLDARFRLHFRYGDPREAMRLMRSGKVNVPPSVAVLLPAKINPTPENVERAKSFLRKTVQGYPNQATGPLQGYAEFGIEEELFEVFSKWERFDPETLAMLFRPAFRKLHQDPRFLQLAARGGVLDYWRDTDKWPDFCFEPDLPYNCKAEAAKLVKAG